MLPWSMRSQTTQEGRSLNTKVGGKMLGVCDTPSVSPRISTSRLGIEEIPPRDSGKSNEEHHINFLITLDGAMTMVGVGTFKGLTIITKT